MEAKKKQANYRRVDCYRCGVEMSRAYVRPPALCAKCKDDIRFYGRHPENADPVVWRVPAYDPNPGDKYAPKLEQRTFADDARDALKRERESVVARIDYQGERVKENAAQRDAAEDRIVDAQRQIDALTAELAELEFQLHEI